MRAEIRTLDAQIEEKYKNIEARQNVTGSYKKERNSFSFQSFLGKRQFYGFPKPFIFGQVFYNGIDVKVLFGLS